MDERLKGDIRQIAAIVSGLLAYMDDLERQEQERRAAFHIVTKEETTQVSKFSDGSFRPRGRGLEYRFMLGGKQRSVCGHSRQECYDKREQLIQQDGAAPEKPVTAREVLDIIRGMNVAGKPTTESPMPLGEWLRKFLETYKKNKLKPRSYREYVKMLRRMEGSEIYKTPLNQLTGEALQDFFNAVPYPNARVKFSHLIRPALRKAVILGMLASNPYASVEIPAHRSEHRIPLQFDQQNAMLAALSGSDFLPVFWVMCCTGMRPGEFIARDWDKDVDYTMREIFVHSNMDINTNTVQEGTKTVSSTRRIRFMDGLVPHLRQLAASPLRGMTYNNFHDFFADTFASLGFAGLNLYSFRHTFISLCYYAGMREKYIQQLAGHSSIKTTLDIYTHVLRPGSSPLLDYIRQLSKSYTDFP